MTVIKMFSGTDKNRQLLRNINDMILETQNKTEEIEEMITSAPYVLSGYEAFRCILRTVKRTGKLTDAVNKYSSMSCPPHYHNTDTNEYCKQMNCNQCWLDYVYEYSDSFKNTAGKQVHE